MTMERSDWPLIGVIGLLVVQVVLFFLSLSELMAISVFCSVTGGSLPPIFTIVHFTYLGLFLLGIASLFWQRGRKIYIVAISIALLALPLQAWLLDHGQLQCRAL
jgi:hypothetical protein